MAKPTKQQAILVEKTREIPLVKFYDGSETIWAFANGDAVRRDVVHNCIAKGLIVPRNDGLFGDSQTYSAVP